MSLRWLPHGIAVAVTIPFAIWIAVGESSGVLPTAAWGLPLAAAYYLGIRIGREVTKVVIRVRGESTDSGSSEDNGEE